VTSDNRTSHPGRAHHTSQGFRNIGVSPEPGLVDFLKWQWSRLWKEIPAARDYNFSLAGNDPAFLKSNHDKTTLTWIGHATVLLQLEGKNILTDPHFTKRASPVNLVGPKRVIRPGLSIHDLPPIHMVIISHDHYDSLDRPSILRLYKSEWGQETTFFVPLGLAKWFNGLGITRVVELDWWARHSEGDFKVTAVPAQHWSKRGLFSKNKTLWAGWVVQSDHFRFFFAGDSGYEPVFKEIGSRLGPFDLSAIPIGAYEPRWFMRQHHMSPEEAIQVHLDVHSKKSVAIHWGTFVLTDEPLDEPPKRLEKVRKEKGLPAKEFLVLKHGESVVIS